MKRQLRNAKREARWRGEGALPACSQAARVGVRLETCGNHFLTKSSRALNTPSTQLCSCRFSSFALDEAHVVQSDTS